MENCGRWGGQASPGILLCLSVLVVLLLAVTSSTSAAIGVTFTVDSTGDGPDANVGDGVCADATGSCTLRAAIEESNASVAFTDTIAFDLPTPPFSIAPTTELPPITDPVEIDGTTQPGWLGAPIVELRGDGQFASGPGLKLQAGSSTVRGLVINGFDAAAIQIAAGDDHRIVGNYIGTDLAGTGAAGGSIGVSVFGGTGHEIGGVLSLNRNVISGSGTNVFIQTSGVTVQGNYIGTDVTGEVALGGSVGVATLQSSNHVIGGDGAGEGNVISGNASYGVLVGGVSSSGHRIVGNLVGTDKDGVEPLPNFNGIAMSGADSVVSRNLISGNLSSGLHIDGCLIGDCLGVVVQGNLIGVDSTATNALGNGTLGISTSGADGVLIGGDTAGEGNIIAANGANGASNSGGIVFGNSARRHRIQGNLIGLGVDGTPLGNTGPGIFCCGAFAESRDNVIGGTAPGEGNQIAYNTQEGVRVTSTQPGTHASIVGNTIHSNGALGIDIQGNLGPTPNDSGDVDTGTNDLQNFPVISDLSVSGGQTFVDVSLDSTPSTTFRLEFFRNSVCDGGGATPPYGRFGEGEALVHVAEVTTDGAGDWSDTVVLAGGTAATEVITATATRFSEAGVSLVGSTSEFSECLADLSIVKTDAPDPVAPGGTITYTLDVANDGPAPANDVVVTDTLFALPLAVTPSQGTCTRFDFTFRCSLGAVRRDGSAQITITIAAPEAVGRVVTNTASVASELTDPDLSDNSSTATTLVAEEQFGTIVVEKQTEPDGSPELFSFSGAVTASLADGQRESSTVAPGAHVVSEMVPAGWDATAIRCVDPSNDSAGSTVPVGPGGTASATFRVAAGETVTCTFTNTQRGFVSLRKTTNGLVDPSKDIVFVLTGPGLPTAGVSRSTFADLDGLLEWPTLVPGRYTVCESPVPAGFTSFWKLDGEIVTPYNPDASKSPPEDLGTRCYDFAVLAGQAVAFEVDNSRPGGDPRTIGYWKNWNRCTGGNQAATAAKNGGAAAGFFLVEDLLPQLVGDFSVTSCQQAVKLLSKQDQAGRSKSSDAAYELGAQLLAARFNLAAGAATCSTVQQAVLDGQTLLDAINFTGSGDYLGSKSKSPNRPPALALAATLDRYNNGNLC